MLISSSVLQCLPGSQQLLSSPGQASPTTRQADEVLLRTKPGDDMKRMLSVLVSIAVLSGCALRSTPSLQGDGMDSERSLGRSVAMVLICNDCRPR